MELFSTVLLIVAAVAIVLYVVITEVTDWVGRTEIIEKRWPRLWAVMNNRPMRLVLILLAIVMAVHAGQELRSGADPPEVNISAPKVPELQAATPDQPEAPDSLRRRTIGLADELYDFVTERQRNHPPYSYPDSNDPNPSEEKKAAIKKCQPMTRKH